MPTQIIITQATDPPPSGNSAISGAKKDSPDYPSRSHRQVHRLPISPRQKNSPHCSIRPRTHSAYPLFIASRFLPTLSTIKQLQIIHPKTRRTKLLMCTLEVVAPGP